mgnify:CR=1 FL=1
MGPISLRPNFSQLGFPIKHCPIGPKLTFKPISVLLGPLGFAGGAPPTTTSGSGGQWRLTTADPFLFIILLAITVIML